MFAQKAYTTSACWPVPSAVVDVGKTSTVEDAVTAAFAPSRLLSALLLLCGVVCADGAVAREAWFLGTLSRDPALRGAADKVNAALLPKLDDAGIKAMFPASNKGPPPSTEPVARLLKQARGSFFDADFKAADQRAAEGISRFDSIADQVRDPAGWALYAELHMMRGMALLRTGDDGRARQVLQHLAVVRPAYVPDPGFVPPKVIRLYDELKAEATAQTGSIQVASTPAGANIWLNGVARGQTPTVLKDIPAGTHHVVVDNGVRSDVQRLEVNAGKRKSLRVQLEHPQAQQGRALLQDLVLRKDEQQLLQKANAIKGDVWVAVVRPSEAGVLVALGRLRGKSLVVVETAVDATLQQLSARVKPLVRAAKAAKADKTLHGGDAAVSHQAFLGATVDDGDSSGLLWLGVAGAGVGALTVVGAGAAVGALLWLNQPPNPGGTDFLVDASRL